MVACAVNKRNINPNIQVKNVHVKMSFTSTLRRKIE